MNFCRLLRLPQGFNETAARQQHQYEDGGIVVNYVDRKALHIIMNTVKMTAEQILTIEMVIFTFSQHQLGQLADQSIK